MFLPKSVIAHKITDQAYLNSTLWLQDGWRKVRRSGVQNHHYHDCLLWAIIHLGSSSRSLRGPGGQPRLKTGNFKVPAKALVMCKSDKRSELTYNTSKVSEKFDTQNKESHVQKHESLDCSTHGCRTAIIWTLQTRPGPRVTKVFPGGHRIARLGKCSIEDGDFFPAHTFANQTLPFSCINLPMSLVD
jgi:hypothetical protein